MTHALIAFLLFGGLTAGHFFVARGYIRSKAAEEGRKPASPLSSYGTAAAALFVAISVTLLTIAESSGASAYFGPMVMRTSLVAISSLIVIVLTFACFSPESRAHRWTEAAARFTLFSMTAISLAFTMLVVLTMLSKSIAFFSEVPVFTFLTGTRWEPQTMDTDVSSFGFIPLITGTLMVTLIAVGLAAVPGVLSGVYLAEIASPALKQRIKPLLEVLTGIPTVIYGYAAASFVGPSLSDFAKQLGVGLAPESALAAGLVMSLMISPILISMIDDALSSVPQSMRDASYAIGATKAETIMRVTLPAASSGVTAGFLLAISRAAGETMIVVMAAGLAATLTANPLEPVTTVTVQIVQMLTGDQDFSSAKTLSAFALGLTLFAITWALNFQALHLAKKSRF